MLAVIQPRLKLGVKNSTQIFHMVVRDPNTRAITLTSRVCIGRKLESADSAWSRAPPLQGGMWPSLMAQPDAHSQCFHQVWIWYLLLAFAGISFFYHDGNHATFALFFKGERRCSGKNILEHVVNKRSCSLFDCLGKSMTRVENDSRTAKRWHGHSWFGFR